MSTAIDRHIGKYKYKPKIIKLSLSASHFVDVLFKTVALLITVFIDFKFMLDTLMFCSMEENFINV